MVANGQLTGGDVESVVRNFDAEKWCKDPYTNSLTPTMAQRMSPFPAINI